MIVSSIYPIITNLLSNLNNDKDGPKNFENLCCEIIQEYLFPDDKFFPSSGQDAGGDGGIDGWSLLGYDGKRKYAFSIDKSYKQKLDSEIKKTNFSIYNEVYYFTNQNITEKIKQDLYNGYKIDNPNIKITIFSQDNIAEIIEKHEELGEVIGLPYAKRKITIDFQRKHNQFIGEQDTIKQYIPRTVAELNTIDCVNFSIQNILCKKDKFLIIESPAGYGKSCFLKSIYLFVLNSQKKSYLPSVYVKLEDYNGSNLEQLLVNSLQLPISEPIFGDLLLLLDGYDEIKSEYKDKFVKELNSFLNSNNSCKRRVILTVRTGFSDIDKLNKFSPLYLFLNKTENKDIDFLFKKYELNPNEIEILKNNKFFKEYSDNIYYCVNLIMYYKNNHSLADNVCSLFNFIIQTELENIFRTKSTDKRIANLETLALYMICNQTYTLKKDDIVLNKYLSEIKANTFSFSHKSVLEYLAAKKIANQDDIENLVKKVFFSGNRVVPYLINTFGFLLNILNTEQNYEILEKLINETLSQKNAFAFTMIERDKIDPVLNNKIFSLALEQYEKNNFDNNASLQMAKFSCGNSDENLDLLIEKIEEDSKKDLSYYPYTLFLETISNKYSNYISSNQQQKILDIFELELKEKGFTEFSNSLFYSICNFTVIKNNKELFNLVFEKVLLLKLDSSYFEGLFQCFCKFIISADVSLNVEQYVKLYNKIIEVVVFNDKDSISFDVYQGKTITKDSYVKNIKCIFLYSFVELTNKKMNDKDFIWNFLDKIQNNSSKSLNLSNEDFKSFDSIIAMKLSEELCKLSAISKERISVLKNYINNKPDFFYADIFWNKINEKLDSQNTIKFIDLIIDNTKNICEDWYLIINILNNKINSTVSFDLFKKLFFNKDDVRNSIYKETCSNVLLTNRKISTYIKQFFNEEFLNEVKKRKKQQNYAINYRNVEKIEARKAVHTLFNIEKLKKDNDNIFKTIGKESISSDEIFKFEQENCHGKSKKYYNEFLIYLFRLKLRSKDMSFVTKQYIPLMVDSENWEINRFVYLILFINNQGLTFDVLNFDERREYSKWANLLIDKYPLTYKPNDLFDKKNKKILRIHLYISYYLREAAFAQQFADFNSESGNKIMGLALTGFTSVVEGCWTQDYSYYSLEYLEKYINKKDLIQFILTNLKSIFLSSERAIALLGYLDKCKDDLKPYQIIEIKKTCIQFISQNLSNSYVHDIVKACYDFGFTCTSICIDDYFKSLDYNKEYDHLDSNLAETLLEKSSIEFDDKEMDSYRKDILEYAYEYNSVLVMKKAICEFYFNYYHSNYEMFNFYIKFLVNKSNNPSISCMNFSISIYTDNYKNLNDILLLVKYYNTHNDGNELCSNFYQIVILSLKAIAKSITKDADFNNFILVLQNNNINDFNKTLLEQLEDIYYQNRYQTIDIEEIEKMK